MDDQQVHVLKRRRSWGGEIYYTVHCTRCHRCVISEGRLSNCEWATKSVAIKHAQVHADWHTNGHWFPDGDIVASTPATVSNLNEV